MGGDSGKKRGPGGGGGGGSNGFKALGLSEAVYKGIVRMGFRVGFGQFIFLPVIWLFNFSTSFFQMPTPVQRKALPVVLTGSDACVMVCF